MAHVAAPQLQKNKQCNPQRRNDHRQLKQGFIGLDTELQRKKLGKKVSTLSKVAK